MLATRGLGELAVFGRHSQAFAQYAQRFQSGVFVAQVARQHVGGRERLAQVVGERGEADGVVAGRQARGHVADQLDVNAGVDFRVVLGGLRQAVERVDFR